MKTRTHALRWAGIAIVLVSMMWGATASADPRRWGENGLVVRPVRDVYTATATARSADGHTLLVWSDARMGSYDLYAQLYDAQGEPLWGAGVPVVQHAASQILPAACAVLGGWIIAWIDMRDMIIPWQYYDDPCTCGNIRAQKLNNDGEHIWDGIDSSGVPVYSMTTETDVAQVAASGDGAGGALITWRSARTNYLYVQRILVSGINAWGAPLALTDEMIDCNSLSACGGDSGSLFVAWAEYLSDVNHEGHVTKVSPAGTLPWGINGRNFCGALDWQNCPQVCTDGMSGCFIGWVDNRSQSPRVRAQHYNSGGNPLWSDTGLAVCSTPNMHDNLRIAASHNGNETDGLLLVWQDSRVNIWVTEIYAQKLSPDGSEVWTANGRKICGDAVPGGGIFRSNPEIASDGHGGLVCAWRDYRDDFYMPSIYTNRVLADSSLIWQGETGIRISQAVASGKIQGLWTNESLATCFYFDDGDDADFGLRRQKLNLTDGACLLPLEGASVARGMRYGAGINNPVLVTMTGGRTAVLWTDERSTLGNRVYLQIVDTAGHIEKDALGEKLLPNDGGGSHTQFEQQPPKTCGDGNGGFFAIVNDQRTGVWQLRAAHFNAEGNLATDSSGCPVEATRMDQQNPCCASDGGGGCYVAWRTLDDNWMSQTKLTHLNSLCQPTWPVPLIITLGSEYDQTTYGLVPNPDGGCTLLSGKAYPLPTRLLITRVSSDGSTLWQRTLDFARGLWRIAEVEDRQGGLFLLMCPYDNLAAPRSLIVQHMNEHGEDAWGANGLQLFADSSTTLGYAAIATDDQNNLCVLYVIFGNTYDLYAQKIAATGVRLWGEDALLLTTQSFFGINPAFCIDDCGGVMALWEVAGPPEWRFQLMGKHINANGMPTEPYWGHPDGGLIFPPQWNYKPSITADHVGGFLVACNINLPTEATNAEALYAQRLSGGPLSTARENDLAPRAFALQQNYPNPFNPTTEIAFDLPRTERVKLAVFDVLGRNVQTLVDKSIPAGTHRVRFDGGALASGIYFYRLEAGKFKAVKKMVMVK